MRTPHTAIDDLSAAKLAPTIVAALPLLAAVGLLMLGNGLTSTLLGIRAGLEGFNETVTGLVLAAYYLGFIVGSLLSPRAIREVGHIRAFAGLGSLASAAVLVHVLLADPFTWFMLRGLSGMCMASMIVVTETWLNGAASNATRGRILSAYMVVVTGGMAGGQLLLAFANPAGFGAFVLGSVLLSLAVVPVSLTPVTAPVVPDPVLLSLRQAARAAPLAVVGAAGAGFIGAATVSGAAIYAGAAGLSSRLTAVLVASMLTVALVAQIPLGYLADLIDRRVAIVGLSAIAGLAGVAAALTGTDTLAVLFLCAGTAGGLSFPLYLLSNTHLNDYLEPDQIASAGARMVLVYGAGAVVGPVFGAFVIDTAGPNAFFAAVAVAYGAVGTYAAWRLTRRAAVPANQRSPLSMVPAGAAPTALALTGHRWADLPGDAGELMTEEGIRLSWSETGIGRPVVVIHDAGDSSDSWDQAIESMASLGQRVICWDLRGHGRSSPADSYDASDHIEDLIELMRDRNLASATIVGHRTGAALAARFAADHPDRVDAAVLVGLGEVLADERPRPRKVKAVIERALDHAPNPKVRTEVVRDGLRRVKRLVRSADGVPSEIDPSHGDSIAETVVDPPRADPITATADSARASLRAEDVAGLLTPVLRARGEMTRSLPPSLGEQYVFVGCGPAIHVERPDELADLVVEMVRHLPLDDWGDAHGRATIDHAEPATTAR